MRLTGSYVSSSSTGEAVQAFVPHSLPPSGPPLLATSYERLNQVAEIALARLAGAANLGPEVTSNAYGAVRKEAVLTSRIEGIRVTIAQLIDSEVGFTVDGQEDVREASNYLLASQLVHDNLRAEAGLPISVRLLCNAHRLLLDGPRGVGKQPGELRRSQNWIGGTRPGNAVFVPPPAERVPGLLADLERFIHDRSTGLPPLVKVGLVHAHFETIHPFLDGNGRIGRLLIGALLENWGLLPQPLLSLSGFLLQHQREYYRRLAAIRIDGDWESWVSFFLEGISAAAGEAEQCVGAVARMIAADRRHLLASTKAGPMCYRLFELLPEMPRFTVEQVRQKLRTTFPTANATVRVLEDLGMVVERTGQKTKRSYSYQAYIDLLSS